MVEVSRLILIVYFAPVLKPITWIIHKNILHVILEFIDDGLDR